METSAVFRQRSQRRRPCALPSAISAALRFSRIHRSLDLSGGDILNICLNAIHAGSRDPDPAKWVVTEKLLVREIRRAKTAKEAKAAVEK